MIYMSHIYSILNYYFLVWNTLISQVESNKNKVLQDACIRILTKSRLGQPTLSMYKAIKSVRFVEMIKLSLVLFMYKYKKSAAHSHKNLSLQHPKRLNT